MHTETTKTIAIASEIAECDWCGEELSENETHPACDRFLNCHYDGSPREIPAGEWL